MTSLQCRSPLAEAALITGWDRSVCLLEQDYGVVDSQQGRDLVERRSEEERHVWKIVGGDVVSAVAVALRVCWDGHHALEGELFERRLVVEVGVARHH